MFWQRLFGLKNKLYISSFGTVYSLFNIILCFVLLPKGLSFFTFFIMIVISVFDIFSYPWVRLALVGDVDHPIHSAISGMVRVYEDIRNTHHNAKQAYKNTPIDKTITKLVDQDGRVIKVLSVHESTLNKEFARDEEWYKLENKLNKRGLKFAVKIIMDIFIWIFTPILIWFLLNEKSFEKAAIKGYLKDEFYVQA